MEWKKVARSDIQSPIPTIDIDTAVFEAKRKQPLSHLSSGYCDSASEEYNRTKVTGLECQTETNHQSDIISALLHTTFQRQRLSMFPEEAEPPLRE